MGFMDGIRDVLGGFNAVKRIDDTGFDWREQDAAQQFARDRQVEEARQGDEDRAVNQIADAYAGAEGGQEPDVSPLLQGIEERRQKFMLDRARGVGKERKSALEDQKTYRTLQQQTMRGDQRLTEIDAQGENRQELEQLREKLRSQRTLNPAEQARLDALERMNSSRIAAGGRGSRGRMVDYYDKEAGENVRRWVPQQELEGSSFEPPLPATMRQGQGMIEGVQANVDKMAELAEAGLTSGPIIGAASKKWQEWMGPSGGEGEFDFLGNAVVDTVYAKSGKQINAEEQRILRQMIPNRAKGNLTEQVRLFDEYINHLFAKYGGRRPSGGGGGGGGAVDPKNLKAGDIYKGMRYKGGPKGSPSSWERP